MGTVVVCGAGVIGLATARMLALDGHAVTVLESDPAAPPDRPVDAWDGWQRRGVVQFHQPHTLLPGSRKALDAELPDMTQRLLDAGCPWFDILGVLPPQIADMPRVPADDRFRAASGRRPVVEAVFAAAAAETPGVEISRGTTVTELVRGPDAIPGVPHVAGLRTSDGRDLRCDLVVDAMGRRSPVATWLGELGTPPVVESEDCGFVYYTRYYRGAVPPARIGPAAAELGTFSLLTGPGDNDTWSITIWASSRDAPLKELRHTEAFTRVVRACPLQAHWTDGEPITDVLPMAGVLDSYRRYVVDGRPAVTGLAAVGDSWASTNPSAGRGVSVGLLHAQQLRRVVASSLDDPPAFAEEWDAATTEHVEPFYRRQLQADRARVAQMNALRDGQPPVAGDPTMTRLAVAANQDPEVFRAMVELMTCLATPAEVFARPGLMDRIDELGQGEPGRLPGPDREQLLALLAG